VCSYTSYDVLENPREARNIKRIQKPPNKGNLSPNIEAKHLREKSSNYDPGLSETERQAVELAVLKSGGKLVLEGTNPEEGPGRGGGA